MLHASHQRVQLLEPHRRRIEGTPLTQSHNTEQASATGDAYNKILTAANVISFARLCLIPLYLALLLNGFDIAAMIVFAVAALTDFVDGQVARRTNTVSRLGILMDPAIDTLLMITGVLGVLFVGRIPLWVVILVFAREAFLLIGGAILLKGFHIHIPVVYPGKVATTLLFFGFAALFLYLPTFAGPGIVDADWLPGLNSAITSWGIYFVYAGLALQIGVTVYYCVEAARALAERTSASGAAAGGER